MRKLIPPHNAGHSPLTIAELENNLTEAVNELEGAERRLGVARGEHTAAINRVNDAQKQFDARVAAIRKDAPRDTDWKRPTGVQCG